MPGFKIYNADENGLPIAFEFDIHSKGFVKVQIKDHRSPLATTTLGFELSELKDLVWLLEREDNKWED